MDICCAHPTETYDGRQLADAINIGVVAIYIWVGRKCEVKAQDRESWENITRFAVRSVTRSIHTLGYSRFRMTGYSISMRPRQVPPVFRHQWLSSILGFGRRKRDTQFRPERLLIAHYTVVQFRYLLRFADASGSESAESHFKFAMLR
jgi:hypothetical protein